MKFERKHELDLSPKDHEELSEHIGAAFAENSASPGDRSFFFQPPHMRIICRIGDDLAGHLAIYLRTVRVGEQNTQTAAIGDVSVAKAYRRKGIASQLVKEALEIAEDIELDFVWLAGDEQLYFDAGFFSAENEVTRISWDTGQTITNKTHDMLVHDLDGWDWDQDASVNLLGPML